MIYNLFNFETKLIEHSKDYGIIKLINNNFLLSGFSITIGNALRRVLLNNIMGTAIVKFSVKKPNGDLLFLRSVKEDLFEIGSNFKKVVLRSTKLRNCEGFLSVKGPAVVTAGDLIVPDNILVVNPNQYLFAILNDEKVHLKFEIEQGFGYKFYNDKYLPLDDDPASFVLDANFTPITKVNYKVLLEESELLPNRTVESLLLEIWTNGAITPYRAFLEGSKMLASVFTSLIN